MSSILAHESHLFVTGTALQSQNGSRGVGSFCRFKSHVLYPVRLSTTATTAWTHLLMCY